MNGTLQLLHTREGSSSVVWTSDANQHNKWQNEELNLVIENGDQVLHLP